MKSIIATILVFTVTTSTALAASHSKKAQSRKTASGGPACSTEAYAAAYKTLIAELEEDFSDFQKLSFKALKTDFKTSKNVVSANITIVYTDESTPDMPNQKTFLVTLDSSYDNRCPVKSVKENTAE